MGAEGEGLRGRAPRATPSPALVSQRGRDRRRARPQMCLPPVPATPRPPTPSRPAPPSPSPPPLALVVIGDVVGGLGVDEQGWQAQWLVGLVPQADVVVPWEGGRTRWLGPERSPHTLPPHCPEPRWPHLSEWQRQAGSGGPRTCRPPQRPRCAEKPVWVAPPEGPDWSEPQLATATMVDPQHGPLDHLTQPQTTATKPTVDPHLRGRQPPEPRVQRTGRRAPPGLAVLGQVWSLPAQKLA